MEVVSRDVLTDFDTVIKFFRKVVEGINHWITNTTVDNSKNRTKKVRALSKSAFNLLSNLGEHTGTAASSADGKFAASLASNLAAYVSSKSWSKARTTQKRT